MGILDITPNHELLSISDILNIQNMSYVSEVFFKKFDFNKLFSQADLAKIQESVGKMFKTDELPHSSFNYSAVDDIERIFKERLTKHLRKQFRSISNIIGSTFKAKPDPANQRKGVIINLYLANPLDKNWLRRVYFSCEYWILQ